VFDGPSVLRVSAYPANAGRSGRCVVRRDVAVSERAARVVAAADRDAAAAGRIGERPDLRIVLRLHRPIFSHAPVPI